MLIEFTFGDMVEGLSPDGRATVSVYTHGGSTIERLKTHTQNCTVFDRAVLRCLLADLVVEGETARGFLAYPWFKGISNLLVLCQRGETEIMCLWVCLGWGWQMQHSFTNSVLCCCWENHQNDCKSSLGFLSGWSSSSLQTEEGFVYCCLPSFQHSLQRN